MGSDQRNTTAAVTAHNADLLLFDLMFPAGCSLDESNSETASPWLVTQMYPVVGRLQDNENAANLETRFTNASLVKRKKTLIIYVSDQHKMPQTFRKRTAHESIIGNR